MKYLNLFYHKMIRYIGKAIRSCSKLQLTKIQIRRQHLVSKLKKSGENLQIFGDIEILCPEKIIIGNNCKINSHAYLNARSGICIGNDVTISAYVKILSTGYDLDAWIERGVREHTTDQPVRIGDFCWLCAGAIILPGVQISGKYVVVGAGAVVTHDITEDYVVVAGSPAKAVRKLRGDSDGK